MKKPKYIEVFGKRGEVINVKNLIPLNSYTDYGNLELKILCVAQSAEYINFGIDSVWNKFSRIRSKTYDPMQLMLNSQEIPLMMRDMEVVIYFIRRTIDDMISLIFILDNDFPEKIKIDSIGRLLENKVYKNLKYLKDRHKDSLDLLNRVANSYKHSFVNYDKAYTAIGRDEPCVLSVTSPYNDLNKPMEFSCIALNDIVALSQEFLFDAKKVLSKTE
jgi:hypothetical protein